MTFVIITFAIVLPFFWWLLRFYWSALMTRDLPPGPFPFPVIGNLHLLSPNTHISLMNLAKKYGNLMTIYFGTERAVIVSDPELAREVLVRQSSIFGGRPRNLSFGASLVTNNGKDIVFHRNMSILWKKERKLFHGAVKLFGSGLMVLQDKVCDVVEELLGQLDKYKGTVRNIDEDIHLCVANINCNMTFGSKYEKGDKEFESIVKVFELIQRSVAPGHLVDVFPFLRRFPIKQVCELKNANEFKNSIMKEKFDVHVRRLQDGDARDFTEALLKQRKCATSENINEDLTDEHLQLVLFDMFVAGFETSSATILWGICLLARHPEIQDDIYKEMRRYLKPNALPTFNDRHQLPLLQATVTEIHRYSSILPILLPHRAVDDAYISNYFIPKDTTVFVNVWAIHHDPRNWKDPQNFRPSRFIDQDGNYSPPAPKTFLPFGAGKRGCAGEVLGKMVVFLTLSRMLYSYRFIMVSDQNVGLDTAKQILIAPKSFEVLIEKNKWNE